jgi:formylglycine-generating enzyme required for sulfatase activity/tRNA A-37 threonylcarbamoyl transferase component Bud32
VSILFLGARAKDLALTEEFNALARELDEWFDLNSRWGEPASNWPDLLDRYDPQVLHFSGHGNEGGLFLTDASGRSHVPKPSVVAEVFAPLRDRVRCVVLNACYSEAQALLIAEHIDVVIGIDGTIGDARAREFSQAFYNQLGKGHSVGEAFERAKLKLALGNDKVPALRIHSNVDPRKVVLGRGDGGETAGVSEIAAAVETIIEQLYARRKLRQGSVESQAVTAVIDEAIRLVRRSFTPEVGSVIAGARLEKVVGYGNFGTVWEAYDEELQKKVAVKVFKLEALGEGQMLYRFGRSIRAMRLLSEPSRRKRMNAGRIVEFHKADATGLAFSMEFHSGGDLREIERLGWEREKKIAVMLQICAAVEYSHANGVIHRDIKPANIVLDARGAPVLTDFDIADIKFATSLSTSIEGGLGTPIFAAPEQLSDEGERSDERADIYSLGRLLHFLLLERSPGLAVERNPTLGNLSQEPAALVEVVQRATQYDPRKRYRSVAEMRQALQTCMSGAAAWKAMALRTGRALQHNWHLATILGLVILGLLAALTYQADVAKKERLAAEQERLAAEEQELIASRERNLRSSAESAQKFAEEAMVEAERARTAEKAATAKFIELYDKLDEVGARAADLIDQKSRLEMKLDVKRRELKDLGQGSPEYAKLAAAIAADTDALDQVEAKLEQIETDRMALEDELAAARARAEGASAAIERLPTQIEPGAIETPRPTKIDWVFIDGGRLGERDIEDFYLARTEVTVADYHACVKAGKCFAPTTDATFCNEEAKAKHPVTCVLAMDAANYCEWVNGRLPTEWEWEWAARSRDKGWRYPWGDGEPGHRACWNRSEGTCEVGSHPAGASVDGVEDLAGNVGEWTASRDGADASRYVLRGGGWSDDNPERLSARNRYFSESHRVNPHGFRCAR